MLPFTKRPGRGGEDGEVFTKDDLDDLAATNEKPATASPPSKRPAAKDDFSDDEVTNFIPSKSVSAIVHDARKPGTIPPPPASRRPPASIPPPPMSQRPGKFLTSQASSHVSGADEDEDGRTVVRGAPKIVKKSVPPAAMAAPSSSMSPAAVIKATLESARAAKRANEGALMPPPPAELLEDMTDRLAADDPRLAPMSANHASRHHSVPPPPQSQRPQMMQSPYTAPMGMQPVGVTELGASMLAGMGPHSQPAPSSHGPMTGPPAPMHLGHGYAPASPSGSIPPPPQSYRPPNSFPNPPNSHAANQTGPHQMPAHFMVPNAPYSDGRMDPPGTSVTARHRTPGRPASAWAMALVAAGLFVGVGAVAVMQSNDSLMDTTASFVDPSRAGAPKAAAQPVAEPAPQAAPTTAIAPTVVVPPAVNPDPAAPNVAPPAGGVIGASAPAVQPQAPVAAAAPAAPEPKAAPAAVAANPAAAAAPKTTWIAPTPKPQAPVAAAPAPAPAPKPAAAPKPAVASNEDAPEKPAKPTKPAKPGKGDATDDETKKALEALQKAQLESGF